MRKGDGVGVGKRMWAQRVHARVRKRLGRTSGARRIPEPFDKLESFGELRSFGKLKWLGAKSSFSPNHFSLLRRMIQPKPNRQGQYALRRRATRTPPVPAAATATAARVVTEAPVRGS